MAPDYPPGESESFAGRIELRPDPQAKPGDALPALARLLRQLRDSQRRQQNASPELPATKTA
jgi:hypothetical protein